MPLQTPLRVSLSSWALHSLIGTVAQGRPGDLSARMMESGDNKTDLLHVPRLLRQNNIGTMELCHFHVPDRSSCYLSELRGEIEAANIELWSYLIDDGDILHPEHGLRDQKWVVEQMDAAAELGARCVRVIAGKQPATPETLRHARTVLEQLAGEAYLRGLRVLTENWFALLSKPESVNALLDGLNGAVGLCLDFGNWGGATKYDDLAEIAGWAESCHAKCAFYDGKPDADDFTRCLEITRQANFSGPYTIVYAEPGDIWGSIKAQADLIAPFLQR